MEGCGGRDGGWHMAYVPGARVVCVGWGGAVGVPAVCRMRQAGVWRAVLHKPPPPPGAHTLGTPLYLKTTGMDPCSRAS